MIGEVYRSKECIKYMNKDCHACKAKRYHEPEEFATFHPNAGHGFSDGKWSKPELEEEHKQEVAKRKLTAAQDL